MSKNGHRPFHPPPPPVPPRNDDDIERRIARLEKLLAQTQAAEERLKMALAEANGFTRDIRVETQRYETARADLLKLLDDILRQAGTLKSTVQQILKSEVDKEVGKLRASTEKAIASEAGKIKEVMESAVTEIEDFQATLLGRTDGQELIDDITRGVFALIIKDIEEEPGKRFIVASELQRQTIRLTK